jgi:hypothetical protein
MNILEFVENDFGQIHIIPLWNDFERVVEYFGIPDYYLEDMQDKIMRLKEKIVRRRSK